MSKLIIMSDAIMEILNREIPKLFSEDGNAKYRTSDIELCFLDDDRNEIYLHQWYVEIPENKTDI